MGSQAKKESSRPFGFVRSLVIFLVFLFIFGFFMVRTWYLYPLLGDDFYLIMGVVNTCLFLFCLVYGFVFFLVKFRGMDTLKERKEGVVSRLYGPIIPLFSKPKIEVKFDDDPTPKRVYGFFGFWDKEIFKPGTKVVCYFYESGKIVMGYEKKEEAKEQSADPQRQKDTEGH
jgi:hypothetical protein